MKTRPHQSALMVGALLVGSLGASAQAQSTPPLTRMYRLDSQAQYGQGCFGACECPVVIANSIHGTFRLTRTNSDPLFEHYSVSNVNWIVAIGQTSRQLTGAGTYRVGGEVAVQNEMALALSTDGAAPEQFDSGLVIGGGQFPKIDITISIVGAVCYNTAIRVSASPITPAAADLNGDGVVDASDLATLLGAWGTDDPACDLNGDGVVDSADLGMLLGSWGTPPA